MSGTDIEKNYFRKMIQKKIFFINITFVIVKSKSIFIATFSFCFYCSLYAHFHQIYSYNLFILLMNDFYNSLTI